MLFCNPSPVVHALETRREGFFSLSSEECDYLGKNLWCVFAPRHRLSARLLVDYENPLSR